MRVVLIGPVFPYRGGISHYTTMLAKNLVSLQYELLLISFKRQYPQWIFPGRSDKDPSNKPLQIKNVRYLIDSLNPITWFYSFVQIWRFRPSIIILQWWSSFWAPVWFTLGLLNSLFLRTDLLYICHNVQPHESNWFDKWVAKIVFMWGSRFIVQSKLEKSLLESIIHNAKVTVVPHPIYDMFLDQCIPKDEARAKLGVGQNAKLLLFFGIVRKYKRLEDVIKSLPLIHEAIGNIFLLIAGEFWVSKDFYLSLAERLNVRDSILIHDRYIPNEEVGHYFSAADMLVAPYRNITGSGVVMIAKSFGLPFITTYQDGNFGDNANELLVEPGNIENLATSIINFFKDKSKQKKTNQRKNLYQEDSWNRLIEVIEKL